MQDLTVIIPTFNEEACIERTIKYVLNLYPDVSIIVADDGSKDKTHDIVKEFTAQNPKIKLLNRDAEPIHGITISVMDAVMQAKTPFFLVMDGDLQHPPEKVKEMHQKLVEGADVVVGARPSLPKDWSLFRRTQSNVANYLAVMRLYLTGCPSEDPVSGFFGGKVTLFQDTVKAKRKRFVKPGYKVLVDYLKVLPKSTKLAIVHYEFRMREAGTSKIGLKHIFYHLKSVLT